MTRAALLLALTIALMLGTRSFVQESGATGSGAALALGFLLIASIQVGRMFHHARLPHLTGFILAGAIFGPEIAGLITPEMVSNLALVKRVAVGLIALLAGCELNARLLKKNLRSIGAFSASGLLTEWICLFGFFMAISSSLDLTAGMSWSERAVVSLVCATALSALSPAVVIGIITETRAKGPLTEMCLSIVVLADLAIVVAFALTQSIAAALLPNQSAPTGLGSLVIHIFGSLGTGLGVGTILALYIRRVGSRIGLFTFGMMFVVAEAGPAIHIDPLLVGLTAGLFVENVSPISGHEVVEHVEPATLPTFAVFFAVIGAQIRVHDFFAVFAFGLGAAAVRAAALWAGTRLVRGGVDLDTSIARLVPLGMLPQAGIAIALANLVRDTFQPWGPAAATLILGTIVVNEMIGPVLFRMALASAGEIGGRDVQPVTAELEVEPK